MLQWDTGIIESSNRFTITDLEYKGDCVDYLQILFHFIAEIQHLRILISKGVLEPISHEYQSTTVLTHIFINIGFHTKPRYGALLGWEGFGQYWA